MELSLFSEDSKKQSEGTRIYLNPDLEGYFLLKRWGTDESKKALKEIKLSLFGPIHNFSDDDESLIWAHWLVEYGVAGWDEITAVGGGLIPYSKYEARKIFLNPEYMCVGNINTQLINNAFNYENYLYDDALEVTESIKK